MRIFLSKTNFTAFFLNNLPKKIRSLEKSGYQLSVFAYFLRYITSFTSFTVRGTSGK